MKREFFGVDVSEALTRASARLGIPVDDLKYETLELAFHLPTGGEQVAILVDFDESAAPKVVAVEDASFDEVVALRDDPVRMGAQVLEQILKKMGYACAVEATTEDANVLLSVHFEGEKPDFRRGEIRELRGALQYLINRIAGGSRESDARYLIDFTGNLEDRRALMAALADELSAKAGTLDKDIHIQLMDSQDRRLLHLALVDHDQVSTSSDGEGRFRVLSVSAKKNERKSSGKRGQDREPTEAEGGADDGGDAGSDAEA